MSAQGLAQPNGEVAKSLFLVRKSDNSVTDLASQLSYAMRKVLQRGELPFCTLLVEQAICDHLDLSEFVEPFPETSSEIGFETEHTVSDAAINKWLVTSCSENVNPLSLLYFQVDLDQPSMQLSRIATVYIRKRDESIVHVVAEAGGLPGFSGCMFSL